jgi:Holliday junction resolvase YEN1
VKIQVKEKKKYIMLRDSLPGGWKEVDEDQVAQRSGRAWRLSQVEVLNMMEE